MQQNVSGLPILSKQLVCILALPPGDPIDSEGKYTVIDTHFLKSFRNAKCIVSGFHHVLMKQIS